MRSRRRMRMRCWSLWISSSESHSCWLLLSLAVITSFHFICSIATINTSAMLKCAFSYEQTHTNSTTRQWRQPNSTASIYDLIIYWVLLTCIKTVKVETTTVWITTWRKQKQQCQITSFTGTLQTARKVSSCQSYSHDLTWPKHLQWTTATTAVISWQDT